MDAFELIASLTTLAAAFSWINHRFIRLPTVIGLMVISLLSMWFAGTRWPRSYFFFLCL